MNTNFIQLFSIMNVSAISVDIVGYILLLIYLNSMKIMLHGKGECDRHIWLLAIKPRH